MADCDSDCMTHPAAEWTLASVLKTGGYKTFFTGKWHLGEAAGFHFQPRIAPTSL